MKTKISIPFFLIVLLFLACKSSTSAAKVTIPEDKSIALENNFTSTDPLTTISGTIENYKNGEGTITENNFWTGDKTTLSTITARGNFNIPLDQDFFNTGKKRMDSEMKNMPKGGKIKYHRVNTIFECSTESFGYKNNTEKINDSISIITYTLYGETNQATFKNGETIILKLPLLNLTDKQGNSNSLLYAASTPEVASWLYGSRQGEVKKGYGLEWIFLEKSATVKGRCDIPTSTDNGEEYTNTTITDLRLQKGWNIVKYDITEVFTSTEGQTQAKMTKISTISEIPKDLKWFAIASE